MVNQHAAVVFHDKDLSEDGGWVPAEAERYYSEEATLLLAYKWSRDDVLAEKVEVLEASKKDAHHRALAEFRRRRDSGELPERRDTEHAIGQFIKGNYAHHRFSL